MDSCADTGLDQHAASLVRRLQDAERDHAMMRRSTCDGAAAQALDADCGRWIEVGEAIAALAGLIRGHCLASQFCNARPAIVTLAARLSEAIDDQLDAPSWTLVDAAARLGAAASQAGKKSIAA